MPEVFTIQVVKSEDRLEEAKFVFDIIPGVDSKLLSAALSLQRDILHTNFVMRRSLDKITRLDLYDSYVDQLKQICDMAFVSPLPDFAPAQVLLANIREDFIGRTGDKFRLLYIRRMSMVSALIGFPALLYGAYFSGPIESLVHFTNSIRVIVYAGSWALVGMSISVWLSAVLRNRRLDWASLTLLDPDGFPPILRFAMVCAITFLFALLLYLDVIKIGIGTLELGKFFEKPSAAALLGVIAGLGEEALSKLVVGRVQTLLPDSHRESESS